MKEVLSPPNVSPEPRILTVNMKPSRAKNGQKVHGCFCGKSFTRAEHLRRHQTTHDERTQLVCPFPACGRPFYRHDLFQLHQERHQDPATRVGGNQKIPGCTFAAIRISKENGVKAGILPIEPLKSQPTPSQGSLHCLGRLVHRVDQAKRGFAKSRSTCQSGSSNDDNCMSLMTILNLKKGRNNKQNGQPGEYAFKSLGVHRRGAPRHVSEIQRAVGWNVDPFFNMPRFKDHRIRTQEVYHHCLKALGWVGKSPRWVEEIVQSRIGFLSSLCLAASHLDVLRGAENESAVTLAAKSEVMALIRGSTMDNQARTSDLTLIAIAQLLSSEMIFSDIKVLMMHIKGLESIIRMRGGLHGIGWNDEMSAVIGAKIMLVSIFHEISCPRMFSNVCYEHLTPHFPDLGPQIPESPTYAVTENLDRLNGVDICSPASLAVLRDMKYLTDAFYIRHKTSCKHATTLASNNLPFERRAEEIRDRLFATVALKTDPYNQTIHLASQIYATALKDGIPFSTACQRLSTPGLLSIPELMSLNMAKTDLITCWDGSMSGVLLWSSLIGAAAASGLRDPTRQEKIDQAGRWLRFTAMYCVILISTPHAAAFMESAKCVLDIQMALKDHGDLVEPVEDI